MPMTERACGILLHITSLPSPYGIGTLGKAAENFVDFLRDGGQKYWQVLPINPAGFGNSPYQSYSAFAAEPLLIDVDDLIADGLLTKANVEGSGADYDYGADPTFVDFPKVIRVKMRILREAFRSFSEDVAYLAFISEEAPWLDDYALFMSLKSANGGKSFTEWDRAIRSRDGGAIAKAMEEHAEDIKFWKFVQFIFRRQWGKLRRYANKNGVKIIGDIPIYASPDSADAWTNGRLFLLDSDGRPTHVAGVPPDYFSKTGQLWGNPLYNWDEMRREGYLWWLERLKKAAQLYDVVRIDHFRAFDTYYAIPGGAKTAETGEWRKGPGMELFNAIAAVPELAACPIIAEDLGELFDSVKDLLAQTGFPGMKILQFGFNAEGKDNEHLPHNYARNMVVYTGTHDNSTLAGYLKSSAAVKSVAKRYLRPNWLEPLHMAAIRALYASCAATVIVPLQDVLGLDDRARMNTPGTVGGSNWLWRAKSAPDGKLARKLRELSAAYYR